MTPAQARSLLRLLGAWRECIEDEGLSAPHAIPGKRLALQALADLAGDAPPWVARDIEEDRERVRVMRLDILRWRAERDARLAREAHPLAIAEIVAHRRAGTVPAGGWVAAERRAWADMPRREKVAAVGLAAVQDEESEARMRAVFRRAVCGAARRRGGFRGAW